jgi:hypothetical protein
MDSHKLMELINRITEEIDTSNKNLLSIFPIATYIESIEKYPELSNYGYVSQGVKDFCEGISSVSGEQILDLYHRLIILKLILKSRDKLLNKSLPMVTKEAYNRYFEKIINDIDTERNERGFYLYANNLFKKDLGICRLKLIPAGPILLDNTRLSRRFILRGGIKEFVTRMLFIGFEIGGFGPLLDTHLDTRPDSISLPLFNPEGWRQFYRITAEIFKLNTEIKGWFGTCWFYDPQIEKLSPKLRYIRELGKQFGGKFFYVGTGEDCIKDATFKSLTRRRLFEEGKYIPTSYLLIVPRKRLLKAIMG